MKKMKIQKIFYFIDQDPRISSLYALKTTIQRVMGSLDHLKHHQEPKQSILQISQKDHLVAISEDGWLSFCNYSPILAQKASKEGEKNLKISAQKIELFSEEKLVSCAACNNQPLVLVSSMMRGQKQARIFVFQKDQNSKKLSISSTLDLRNEAFSNVSNSFIKEMSISGSLEQGKCSILAFTHAGGFELLGFELKQKSSSNQLILTRNGTIEGYHTRSVLNSEIFDQKFWSVDGNGCLFSTKQSIFM